MQDAAGGRCRLLEAAQWRYAMPPPSNPMKKRFLWLTLFCGIVTLGVAHAQPGKSGDKKSSAPKSAGDLAFDEYEKVRLDRTAKPDQARFQKVIASGLGFLAQYPTHGRASEVVRTLGGFGGSLAEKNQ